MLSYWRGCCIMGDNQVLLKVCVNANVNACLVDNCVPASSCQQRAVGGPRRYGDDGWLCYAEGRPASAAGSGGTVELFPSIPVRMAAPSSAQLHPVPERAALLRHGQAGVTSERRGYRGQVGFTSWRRGDSGWLLLLGQSGVTSGRRGNRGRQLLCGQLRLQCRQLLLKPFSVGVGCEEVPPAP